MRATMVCVFLAYKQIQAELRRELVTKSTSGGCGQFETSPDAIEPELRTALLILVLSSYLVYSKQPIFGLTKEWFRELSLVL